MFKHCGVLCIGNILCRRLGPGVKRGKKIEILSRNPANSHTTGERHSLSLPLTQKVSVRQEIPSWQDADQ